MKSTHKVVAWLTGAALLVTVGIVLALWAFRHIETAASVRQHTSAVIKGAHDLMSALKDAETGQRGYLLTGDDDFLKPYLAVRDNICGDLEKLRQITLLDAARNHLDALSPLIDAKLANMAEAIELHHNHSLTASIALVRSSQGKHLMDAIRTEMASFLRIEDDLLAQREDEFQTSMQLLLALIVITSLLALFFAVAFAWLIYRETQQQLKDVIHRETQHLLESQEALNLQLQQANTTLRDSEERLAVTLNSIGDAVIATDASARVVRLNHVAEQLTGWTQIEAAGLPVDEVFHIINQETRQPAKIPVIDTLAHGTIQGLANHTVLIARNGSECAIADSCAPIRDRDAQVVGAVLVFRNVTKEYAIQQALHDRSVELERTQSVAEKANLAKSDFLSSMSHELRTPLNAILGFAQLLETGVPPPTPTQKRNIEQILKGGWYLLELINEILDLALIESGRVSLSGESVSLLEVMLECRAMIEPQAQKRGIGMTFPRFDVPHYVKADRTRLKQVLINLLFNAIKYNKPSGAVSVEYTLNPPDSIRISVRDTGVGLAPEQIAQLFQPFNRIGREATAEEGTGIGLVVTKRLIELMGGTIGAESTVGEGSVFWIELSLTAAPQLSEHKTEHGAPLRPRLPNGTPLHTLLYVEDNPANLELVEQLVARRSDLRLLSAPDANLGIEFARAYLPEVILMDINLPGISGIDAMQILRLDPATAHIPIIAISANAMPRDIDKALEAGFFDYVTKPIKVGEFMDKLDEALRFTQAAAIRVVHKEPAS